jgi:hypothetical protein
MDRKRPLKVKMVVPRKNLELIIDPLQSLSEMGATRPKMLRLPEALHTKLVIEAGERTAKTGKRVSVNEVIVSILESFFELLGGKRG